MTCWKTFEFKPQKGDWIEIIAITHIDCQYDPNDKKECYRTSHVQTERVLWRHINRKTENTFEDDDLLRELLCDDWN